MDKLQQLWNAFDAGLVATVTAIFVAGLAAVLGIWMERDVRKPPRYAYALSGLIVLAMFVSITQSYLDKIEQDGIKEDMARLLQTMDKLATESDNPELLALVQAELSAQSRANPEVVEKVAQRVADAGEDPQEMLGKHLGESELESVSRKGTIKPKETGTKVADRKEKEAEVGKDAAPTPTRGARGEEADDGGGRRRAAGADPAAEQPVVPAPTPAAPVPTADAAAAPTRRGATTPTATVVPTAPVPPPTDAKAPAPKPDAAKRPAKDAKTPAPTKKGR